MSLEFLTVNCIEKKISFVWLEIKFNYHATYFKKIINNIAYVSICSPTFFNFKNVAHCLKNSPEPFPCEWLMHWLYIFEKLTIVPESESITDDIMRYNLVF